MNEAHQAYRIRQALNQSLNDISPASARRLQAARHLALSRQKQPEEAWALSAEGMRGLLPLGGRRPSARLGSLLAVAALLTGMWLSFYWNGLQYTTELEEVDSALLSDDLPPEALLDKDFLEWLKDDSSEE